MKRKTKLFLNTSTAILNQIVALIFGLIVPKLIISIYGSEVNGLISSITQFLAFFSLLEMGVGGVIRSSLYKPLAYGDIDKISQILKSGRRFFCKIGLIMIAYTIILMIVFPTFINNQLGYISTAILILAISISYISEYMFGIINQLLLTADQKVYIQMIISSITIFLNTLVSIILIRMRVPIHFMKLASSTVLLTRPLLLRLYVIKNYDINYGIELSEEPLKQKWNALTQSVAYYIAKYSDSIILTLFSTLTNVSIYFVYTMVTNSIQKFIELCTTGMGSLLGDMYARSEKKLINTFSQFEFITHFIVTWLFTVTSITIMPFINVYLKDVNDVNYIVPIFSALIVLASAIYSLRLPYNTMVQSAGHFKQTQTSAIIEAALNVSISILLVIRFGLVGVAIGTVIAMAYRTFFLAKYLSVNIIYRPLKYFVKHIIVDIIIVILSIITTLFIPIKGISYFFWIVLAIKITFIVLLISLFISYIFYKNEFVSIISDLRIKNKQK